MNSLIPGLFNSNPSLVRTSFSSFSSSYLFTTYYSDGVRSLIMLMNDGAVLFSNLAANKRDIVAIRTKVCVGIFQWLDKYKYLSKILTARKRVPSL